MYESKIIGSDLIKYVPVWLFQKINKKNNTAVMNNHSHGMKAVNA